MKVKALTYQMFLDSRKNCAITRQSLDTTAIVEHFRPAQADVSRFAPATFILDFFTKRFLYVEETCFNVLGYKAEWFMKGGLEEYLRRWHPADFKVINTVIFQDSFSFLQKLHPEEYGDYIFSYNYRLLNPKGESINILQRFSYVPDYFTLQPGGMVGVVFDITHYKTENSIIHTIELVTSGDNEIVHELCYKKIHPVYEEMDKKLFSNREIECLRSMAKGLSSKQIASELHLSVNTINNHRRNMLRKVNCKSSSELVNYASKHGLL